MKNGLGKFVLTASCGLGLCLNAQADASTENPYTPIINRNAFALNPLVEPKVANDAADAEPSLPKITVQGFMNLLGKPGVLFKISLPAGAGQPATEIPCVLAEGEQQNDVKLIRFNKHAMIVIFNNHGIIQEIPLTDSPCPASIRQVSNPSAH